MSARCEIANLSQAVGKRTFREGRAQKPQGVTMIHEVLPLKENACMLLPEDDLL
jgi:hypothetical protein